MTHAFIVTKTDSVSLGSYVFPHRHAQYSYAQKVSDSERVGRCRTQKRLEDVGLRECQKVSESVNGTLVENTSDSTDKVIIRLARCPCTNK